MRLSVLICTYNREKYVYNVLRSVALNTFPRNNYEIILVDNNCTDNTVGECERFCNDFPDITFRRVVEKNQGLSYARNRAIAEASGEILVYVDDDALVNDDFLQAYDDIFNMMPEAMGAGGQVQPLYETEEPTWMSHYTKVLITSYKYDGDKIKENKCGKFPSGGNMGFRREVFEKVGAFNPELGRKGKNLIGAEEKDFNDRMQKAQLKTFYIPRAILYHIISPVRFTKEYFVNLTYSIGKSERNRTLSISKGKFIKRLFLECVKWGGTLVLWCGFLLKFQPQKGNKLIFFRYNVTKGLLGF
ncbi:MAG: glycosyltransferase family 2 protein [Bacteroidales bacterium]|nr:glycosyltransferase family 2 protein [Bacteroidales bacterium]